jgi:acetoin utilization deacetylase AcuC-like enzyme
MKSILEQGPLADRIDWHDGRLAERAEIETIHEPSYVDAVERAAEHGDRVEENTVAGAGSWEPLLAAAGTSLAALDHVLDGGANVALALVRPPGHHAQPAQADGYCFFNHVALAAHRARTRGLERVAIVDWDVHHGNGTQMCFYDRADVLTVSLHMRTGLWGPTHPQTGAPAEVGHADGQGFNVNVELPLGSGDRTYELAFRNVVVPVMEQFRPQLIIGACGQDASAFDGNGRQNVSMDGFRTIGKQFAAAARVVCDGRMVLIQEGGYAVTYAAYCLHATLEGVLGTGPLLEDPLAYIGDDFTRARESVEAVQSALSRYWNF